MRVIILLCMMIMTLPGCDPAVSLTLDSGALQKTIIFPCGKLNIEARSVAKVNYFIDQYFHTNESITIRPDAIRLLHKGQEIDFTLVQDGQEVSKSEIEILGDEKYTLEFTTLLVAGDTLSIIDKGYLHCRNTLFDLGTIHIFVKAD